MVYGSDKWYISAKLTFLGAEAEPVDVVHFNSVGKNNPGTQVALVEIIVRCHVRLDAVSVKRNSSYTWPFLKSNLVS